MKKHDAYKRLMRTSVGDKKVTQNSWTHIKARKMQRKESHNKKDRSKTLSAGVQDTDSGWKVSSDYDLFLTCAWSIQTYSPTKKSPLQQPQKEN